MVIGQGMGDNNDNDNVGNVNDDNDINEDKGIGNNKGSDAKEMLKIIKRLHASEAHGKHFFFQTP